MRLKNEKMMRFIDIFIPISACNLKCHYCYIANSNRRNAEVPKMAQTPEFIGKALSKKRLGGVTLFNLCAWGETMLMPEIVEVTQEILKQGHYVWIVTNGLISEKFNKMIQMYTKDELERLAFKFSFHYLELKRLDLMEQFFETIEKVKKAGCSFTVELTSCDEIEKDIEDMKKIVLEKTGANLQVTVPRDGSNKSFPLLSTHSISEYYDIWKVFDSPMFDFKMSVWGQKRTEYCYAGAWSGLLNLSTGDLAACYGTRLRQNIYKNIRKPIRFIPMGKHCCKTHCFNSHAFLALGVIPQINGCNYEQIRNRKCIDGTEWLNPRMKSFISQRLCDNHSTYSFAQKLVSEIKYQCITKARYVYRKLKHLE